MRISLLLAACALALTSLPLAAQVSFTGNYTQDFDSMGTGTAPPSGWTHRGGLGGANSSWTSSIPASGTQSAATAGTENNTLVVNSSMTSSSSFTSNSQAYNLAASGSSDRCIGTSPTSGAGNILQLRLTNNTGANVSEIRVSYDIRRFTAPGTNQLPGFWLFYSVNGGTTWTNVAALNPVASGATVNVPNSTGVTSAPQTTITLSSPVADGSEIRLRWVDDNAVETSPDQIIGLDNVSVSVPVNNNAPEVALTSPAGGDTFDAPASINLAATATDSDGTISKVEFYNGATKLGEDSSEPYEFAWSNVTSGSYSLTAVATDNLVRSITSTAVNITVTNTDNVAPTVALTAPADGATILTSSTTLTATAVDTDGRITKVEFFNGATKLGEDTTSPYSFNWTGLSTGNYTLTAVATDNDSATTTSAPVSVSVGVPITTTLVAKGSVWKYLDNGSDQGTAWRETSFNDSAWASGPAVLGGGDTHVVTNVNLGPSGSRYITTYFRRTFNVTGAAVVQALNMNIMRDDGVVVYINGVEVARQNLPEGVINYLTDTPEIVSGSDETTYFPATVSPMPTLVEGLNTIAVEVHQRDGSSSDLAFDLELISLAPPGTPPTVALTSPVEAQTFTAPASITLTAEASDSDGTVAKVEFFNGSTKLGEDSSAPYTFDWTLVPQGDYILTAKATDNFAQSTTSAPVSITVMPPNTVPPTVAIISPANNASFVTPATILITADAQDSDGTVAKVEFFNGSTKLGEDTSSPYSFEWASVPVGTYSLTAKATDDLTAATTSSAVTVEVLPNQAPMIALTSPAADANVPAPATILRANVSDPEGQPLTVTFYGREKSPAPGVDFTLVTLPDTQFYSENGNNRFSQFLSQTNWIVSSKDSLNTAFVAHMGDMVQNGDSVDAEWQRADQAMDIIENPTTTLLTHGIPWGGAPGNHDGGGSKWNQYFGSARWAGRPYFQGNYNSSNVNNYQFFSASGLDFIVINLAYNSSTSGNQGVMDWADALLKAHPNRRAIITSHWLVGVSFPPTQAAWGGHGQALYDNLKDNPNLFMMLCGHIHGEGRRQDTFEGRTVYTILQDYQSRSGYPGGLGGGDAWLRYYTFSPAQNKIFAKTYRTTTGAFESDADSEFTLDYNMADATGPWVALGSANVTSGSAATVNWSGLVAGTEYEWYAATSDGVNVTSSAARGFTATAASSNATLANLELSEGTLDPVFDAATTSYSVHVPHDTAVVTITPTLADLNAVVKVNDVVVASGSPSAPISLVVGANVITTLVTAQDGSTTRSYAVTVHRAPSSNANLAGLDLGGLTLDPVFDSASTSYVAVVPHALNSITITPSLAAANATVKVGAETVASGSPSSPISLAVGSNSIMTEVTAQDGSTKKTYTLVVLRAGAITFSAPVYTVQQGATAVQLTLTRSEDVTASSVTIHTDNGVAFNGNPPFAAAVSTNVASTSDFVDLSGAATSVSFAPGESSRIVTVTLIPKTGAALPNKRFSASLSSPTGGSVLGALGVATVQIMANDSLDPTLSISTPAANTTTISNVSPYTVKGLAGDSRGLARVEVVLNGGAPALALLGSSSTSVSIPWTANIEPVEGSNHLTATAFDLSGNQTSVSRSFSFTERQILTLTRVTPAGVEATPDIAGTVAMLATPTSEATLLSPATANSNPKTSNVEPGATVKLTATAKKDYTFSHWSGLPAGAVALGNVVTFVMPVEAADVSAVFVDNPFAGPAGSGNSFFGLIHADAGTIASNATEGFVTGTLTPNTGGLSGKVLIDGLSQSFTATVFGNGSVLFTMGPAKQPTLSFGSRTLALSYNVGAGNDQLLCTLTDSALGSSSGVARRTIYTVSNPVPSALLNTSATNGGPINRGLLTLGLASKEQTPALDASAYPQGDGVGTLTVADTGTVSFSGTLADGTMVTGSSALVAGDECPLFVQLATPGAAATVKGASVSGVFIFDATQADSDVSATDLKWYRPAVTELAGTSASAMATQRYTDGWPSGITMDAVGALYDKTRTVQATLGLGAPDPVLGNAKLLFTDGKLTTPITKTTFNIHGNTLAKIPVTDSSYTLVLIPTTGSFSGTFAPNWASPATAKPAYKGILIQKGVNQAGFGFFTSNAMGDTDPEVGGVILSK